MFNIFFPAQLDFDEAKSSVTPMNHGIAFKISLVPVVEDIRSQCICIHSQVAHAKVFKQKSECLQVLQQVFRTNAQCGSRN